MEAPNDSNVKGVSRNRKLFLGVMAIQAVAQMSNGVDNKVWYAVLVAGVAGFCITAQFLIDRKKPGV